MGTQAGSCLLDMGGGNLHVLLEGLTGERGQQGLKIFARLPGDMNVRAALARCLKAGRRAVRI